MPFAFLFVGTLLVISGLRGTSGQLASLVKSDFTGSDNFIYWIAAFIIVGALGYSDTLKPLSRIFLVLLIVVIFLTDGTGFFSKFTSALGSTSSPSISIPSPVSAGSNLLNETTSSIGSLL